MASRLSQSSESASIYLDEFPGGEDGDDSWRRRELKVPAGNNLASAVACMAYLPQTLFLCDSRHDRFEECVSMGVSECKLASKWRLKERMKTGCVALVLCLNIGVDPPDVIKISPCARMECWIDPFSTTAPKALDIIGKTLHSQYERWQPRARYKLQLDPTIDEVRKLCLSCRKNAKAERVLFHYNGHGVPKPTTNGEIWVFNKSYTQYIPLPVRELDSWLQTPSIYVFDCSAAGMIVDAFIESQEWKSSGTSSSSKDCILLAACESHESLPLSVEFPADIFASCLTTPIKMALLWLHSRSLLHDSIDRSLIDNIPGRQTDRKTLLGELNWIFTAITDAIAWTVLPHELFQRLFRQDLLVASLFRNFLLAERIMRSTNCSPISYPVLPSTQQHHLWDAWDMAAEICISKLPQLIDDPTAEFQPSPFFTEQLTAFEVWLDNGSEHKKPPEQLPMVLQVLLSQSHRFRALVLLGRFLDMGPWAVDLALSVGLFPYVLKLLQTTAIELRQILVFIWAKILAFDKSCQVDLVKDGGHVYFVKFLDDLNSFPEQQAMAGFVLAAIVDGHKLGQEACFQANLIHVCLRLIQLSNSHEARIEPLLLQWLCLCLGKLWEDYREAQIIGLLEDAIAALSPLLSEPQPEVRAAAVFAIGALIEVEFESYRVKNGEDEACSEDERLKAEVSIVKSLLQALEDGSPLVRAEVAVALSHFGFGHKKHLKAVAVANWKPHLTAMLCTSPALSNMGNLSNGCTNPIQYLNQGSSLSSQIGTILKVESDMMDSGRDTRISSSSPTSSRPLICSSPVSDGSCQPSDFSVLLNEKVANGLIRPILRPVDSVYAQCILALLALAKDPSPRVACLGQRALTIIGIEHVVSKEMKSNNASVLQGDLSVQSTSSSINGLVRSSSWLDMHAGDLPMLFRTPSIRHSEHCSPGLRRVYSLEFRPHQMTSQGAGLDNRLTSSTESSEISERSLLPRSAIYDLSCGHFSRPLLSAIEDSGDILVGREEREKIALDQMAKCHHSSVMKISNQIASWDTEFEAGTKATLLLPFAPIVVVANENERIRVWNYEEATSLNTFDNHDSSHGGISKLSLVNELDDCLLLVASCDGNIRIWKDYNVKGGQKLLTAFSSIRSHRLSVRALNAVVDWQQQSGYLYASSEISSIMLWDLGKEQNVASISSSSNRSISALCASQVNGGQFAAGFVDGCVRLFDVRTPERPVFASQLQSQRVDRVVGIGFQPGFDPFKIVSASQAGNIQILDIRNSSEKYFSFQAHQGSLTALAIHRHAPVMASGSSKQIVKVFRSDGTPLNSIRYHPTLMAQRIGAVRCLAFHPYKVVLAAGVADPFVSVYADDGYELT